MFTGHADAEKLRAILDAGTDPVELARITIDGVRRNDLWIFPYPNYLEKVEERHQVVMDELHRWRALDQRSGYQDELMDDLVPSVVVSSEQGGGVGSSGEGQP
ncbi:hypothetical protein, partial [Mycolicibacterium sp. CBMA 213]